MKILNGHHEVKLVTAVTEEHIPLAYIHGDEKVYKSKVTQQTPASGVRKITPYERFDSYEKCFFDGKTNNPQTLEELSPISAGDYLKRDANGYYYEPVISTKFEPLHFNYSLICQRTQIYSKQRTYNQKISCIDKSDRLASQLIQIFANAPERGLTPHNVWINSKDESIYSLASSTIASNDLVFIESTTGQRYAADNNMIDYDEYLNNHTNIWLCCSAINLLETGTAVLSSSALYNETVSSNKYLFKASSFNDNYLPEGGESITFFSGSAIACIVKHYKNKGFIVVSSDRFIENARENYKMIYEILMKIYLMSYVKSLPTYSYACDEPVDYIVKRNQLIANHHFRSDKTYYEIFNSYQAKDFKLIDVILSEPTKVQVSHSPDYIYFKKIGGASDPKKPANGYSILLDTQEVVFINHWHYVIESQISYEIERQGKNMHLKLGHFCSNHVLNTKPLEINLPLTYMADYVVDYFTDISYYIVYKDLNYYAIRVDEWDKTGTLLLLVVIHLADAPISLIDMRVRGGGLPENKADNFNLLDIGHLQGRPLRKSGAFVIKLPLEAEIHHDEIMKKIQQISSAERYFTIIYEQRGDLFEDN